MTRFLTMMVALALWVVLAPAAVSAQEGGELHPRVKMTTNMGTFVLELDAEKAPASTYNFLKYAADGYYENTIFHRIIPTFMIQGGGFTADMTEKSDGLRAPIVNEWTNGLKNKRGTIAMARTNMPDSATAQFFINVVDNANLDLPMSGGAGYAVFGKVVEGMEVVDKIKDVKTTTHPKLPMGAVVPEETVLIQKAELIGAGSMDMYAAKAEEAAKAIAVAREAEAAAKAKAAEEAKKNQERAMEVVLTKLQAEYKGQFETTASGLRWLVITPPKDAASPTPKPTDTVEVHYTGKLTDGTKFDSSVDRGQPASFPLNRVIKGWTEGVGMMRAGEKRLLLIPPDLGYGAGGSPPRIPPNAYLVFEVELLGIK